MKFIKRKVKHVDGTDVMATGYISDNYEFIGEYRFRGMTYGVTVPIGCELGQHDVIPVMGFDNVVTGDQCRQCGITLD